MDAKHTPGPWWLHHEHSTVYVEGRAQDPRVVQEVAAVGPKEGGPEQQLADAALIASAPDMRAALDRIERLAQEWEGMKDTKYRYVAACIRGAMREDDMDEQANETNLRG